MARDLNPVRSRRTLLTAGLAAAIGAVTAAVGRAEPAFADGDDGQVVYIGHVYDDARHATYIENHSNGEPVFEVHSDSDTDPSSGHGIAVFGHSQSSIGVAGSSGTGTGVNGQSVTGNGVHGFSTGGHGVFGESYDNNSSGLKGNGHGLNGKGVSGFADNTGGIGVAGNCDHGIGVQGISQSSYGVYGQSDTSYAVYGFNDSSGTAILGYGQNGEGIRGHTTGSATPAMIGHAFTNTTGVIGFSGGVTEPPVPGKTGVFGFADQDASAVGVRGRSPSDTGLLGSTKSGVAVQGLGSAGRGGQFAGNTAQLRLVPSSATTHPGSGASGDLFLDKSHRLWFCKGGTTWVKLA